MSEIVQLKAKILLRKDSLESMVETCFSIDQLNICDLLLLDNSDMVLPKVTCSSDTLRNIIVTKKR